MQAFERRRTLDLDQAPGIRLSDESDRLDGRVLCQRPAGINAKAVNAVQYSVRQSGLATNLGEKHCGQRAEFGRLVDHRATGG